MSDTSEGPGWWTASDGKWYPPAPPPLRPPPVPASEVGGRLPMWPFYAANGVLLLIAMALSGSLSAMEAESNTAARSQTISGEVYLIVDAFWLLFVTSLVVTLVIYYRNRHPTK